ncbi:alpha/beta fold hydrolase [Polyangium aurulentum]|uniref:alpha/beta fold hydrolase n=1 Tax=Polyangium aurulentum TaxID=2567896 RepID=UPI0010ADF390|nr:alpha/beta fold hydrolase [Polyangium aurulentum]UQA60648.1 alpha/beta hydrolase [Polyangium aurulentum]
MPTVTTNDGAQIAYRSFGEGPRTVILVHGWKVSGAVYDDMLSALDLAGLRVLVPDLRGAGGSSKPKEGYGIQRFAEDILAIADAERLGSFVVVGHSMGGQIAQWLAAHHPDRIAGAVLLCPVPASGLPLPDEMVAVFRAAAQSHEAQRGIITNVSRELSPAAIDKLVADAASTSPDAILLGFEAWRAGGFAGALSQVRAPTLVVGTDDPAVPVDLLRAEIVSKIAGARLAVLPGPGHYVHVERPRETAALLNAFLCALRP